MQNLKEKSYILKNNLDNLLSQTCQNQIQPVFEDLISIHKQVIIHKPFVVLEFGCGFSTFIIADALKKNYDYLKKVNPEYAQKKFPKIYSIDASEKWIENTLKNIPKSLSKFITLNYSKTSIQKYNGEVCHCYNDLPDIVPDFIYLDGPDPNDVSGYVNGLSFRTGRTPISADILLYESTLLPGTRILIDGRVNNVHFLKRNLQRNYTFSSDKVTDQTLFVLNDEKLGNKNILPVEFYK